MAGFLYFKPATTKTVTLADVREWGLGYAFASGMFSGLCIGDTPSGSKGMVFADATRLGDWQPLVQMDQQEWRKIPNSDCYVGFWKAAPPVPTDLERPQQLPGYRVAAGDHEWLIPVTARFDDSRAMFAAKLPCYVDCDDEGKWIEGEVLDVHKHLWEIGQPFRDDMMARLLGGPPADFTLDQLRDAAVGYIQANYVVGQRELTMMRGLTTESTLHGAILAANDAPTYWAWEEQQKKSASPAIVEDSITASGEAA